jgi:hypothetical protein
VVAVMNISVGDVRVRYGGLYKTPRTVPYILHRKRIVRGPPYRTVPYTRTSSGGFQRRIAGRRPLHCEDILHVVQTVA